MQTCCKVYWLIVVCIGIKGGAPHQKPMSHITFKMCQFVLIIHLRDYHYDFDLDIVDE